MHARNAVRVALPGGGRASPPSRGACAWTAAGVGGARALLRPRLTFGGCWVPGRSVTDAGQLTAVW